MSANLPTLREFKAMRANPAPLPKKRWLRRRVWTVIRYRWGMIGATAVAWCPHCGAVILQAGLNIHDNNCPGFSPVDGELVDEYETE